ncbi:hypothetical protein EDB85DRAFT_2151578 [Lactarius pseudohatsudake]|nr:hypothetical protein EDB85DRAFT_2151578 [Lactarius pseudohatsudake]
MSKFSALDRSPSAETFVDGMALGTSVDGISGDMPASAIDPATITSEKVVDKDTGTKYSLRFIENLRDLNVSEVFSANASITFAGGDVEASVNTAFDFSHSHASTGHSILIFLECEKYGPSTRMGHGAKLTEEAKSLINDYPVFRKQYGDYYVHEISQEARFTAVWKCTSQSESTLIKFKSSIDVNVATQGSGKLEAQLNSAAKESNVSMEVQYNVLGDMGTAHININAGVTENLALFNDNCTPVPGTVLLRHYSNIEPKISTSIPMDPDLFVRTRKAFNDIRLAMLLNSTLPSDEGSRIKRRCKIGEVFQDIYSKRSNCAMNPTDLKDALDHLAGLLDELHQILTRHELIKSLQLRSYDDVLKGHHIDFKDDTADWVRSQENIGTFSIGRTNPSAEDIKKYGIEHVSKGSGMETRQEYALFTQVRGSLGFPGGTGVHGTVIGFNVNSHRLDGSNGWWGIVPKTAPLGKKDLTVSVQSEGTKGMHWSLEVWYIPTHLYGV